jgi:hypothetical protein
VYVSLLEGIITVSLEPTDDMSEADLKSFAAIKRREEKEMLLNEDSDDELASIGEVEADSADELNSEADLDLSDSEDDVDDGNGEVVENDGDGGRMNLDQIRRRAARKSKKARKAKQNVIESFVPVKLSTLRKAAGLIPATPDGLSKRKRRGKTKQDEEEDEDNNENFWQELKDGAKEVLAYYAGEETYAVRRLELSDCGEVLGKLYDTQWRRFVIKYFPKSYKINLKGFSKYYKPASKTLLTACKSKYCPPFYIVDLLEDGADPNIQEEDTENTPLHYMCRRGNYQAVRFLVEAGAHVNKQNITRRTPLLAACDTRRNGEQVRIVRYLLTFPAVRETLEFRDNGGNTAAINAIFKSNVWILRELLLAGARVTEEDPGMGYDSAYYVAKWVYAAGLLQDIDQLPPRALQEDYDKQSLLWKCIGARGHYYYAPILLYQSAYKYNADLCFRMCQNKKLVEDKIKYPPKPRRAVRVFFVFSSLTLVIMSSCADNCSNRSISFLFHLTIYTHHLSCLSTRYLSWQMTSKRNEKNAVLIKNKLVNVVNIRPKSWWSVC